MRVMERSMRGLGRGVAAVVSLRCSSGSDVAPVV